MYSVRTTRNECTADMGSLISSHYDHYRKRAMICRAGWRDGAMRVRMGHMVRLDVPGNSIPTL